MLKFKITLFKMMLKKKFNKPAEKRARINMQIRVPQIQLIDDKGKHLGIIDTSKAIHMAYEKGLDLVEVAPSARPPIAKIMDFGKFMYQKEKKERGVKKSAAQELKTVKIGIYTGEHDLMIKAKQVDKFIKKGHTVKVEIFLKGRERSLTPQAKEKIRQFPNFVSEKYTIEGDAKSNPSGFFITLRPAK